MTAHRHECPPCYYFATRCDDPRCETYSGGFGNVFCNAPRLCPKHARAEWHRVCEMVSACVLAACVWDLADACAEIAIDHFGDPTTIGRRAAKEAHWRAVNALCGVEMGEGVPGLPRDGLRERLGTAPARDAFLRYGDHEAGCLYDGPTQDRALLSVEGCTCGFTAALRAAVGEGER